VTKVFLITDKRKGKEKEEKKSGLKQWIFQTGRAENIVLLIALFIPNLCLPAPFFLCHFVSEFFPPFQTVLFPQNPEKHNHINK